MNILSGLDRWFNWYCVAGAKFWLCQWKQVHAVCKKTLPFIIIYKSFFCNFAMFPTPIPRMRVNGGGEMTYIKKDVYLTFCLWRIKTSQILKTSSKNKAAVDVCGICFIFHKLLISKFVKIFVYISAWASALLVRTGWAMRRPQSAGWVTGTDSRAFSLYTYHNFWFNT